MTDTNETASCIRCLLPVHQLPGETIMGWHLWAHLLPRELCTHTEAADNYTSTTSRLYQSGPIVTLVDDRRFPVWPY